MGFAPLTTLTAPVVSTLTPGAAIPVNPMLGTVFNLTLSTSGDVLSAAPGNDGEPMYVRITQGTGAPYTLSYGSLFDFGALGAPVLSTVAGKVDILAFHYVASLSKWCYLGPALGN